MANEIDPLRHLVHITLRKPPPAGYWKRQLTPGERYQAAATYFVLGYFPVTVKKDAHVELNKDERFYQRPNLVSVDQFVNRNLRRILGQLNRRTELKQVQYRGQVRGRILWPATYKARYSEEYDPTRFVCQEVQREYDTPENQLLKFVVTKIDECLRVVPEAIRSGQCYYVATEGSQATAPLLTRIESALAILRRNVYLREISLPRRITDEHLRKARSARLEEYAGVADFYCRYRDTVLSHAKEPELAWQQLKVAGRHVMPLPNKDVAFWYDLGAAILLAPVKQAR